MQSEKPREAKKAQENKIFAAPVPQQGLFMATKKREDQSVAAKLSEEAVDGMDSGTYSEFLHQWVEAVQAIYNPPPNPSKCAPVVDVMFDETHVGDITVRRSCDPVTDRLFMEAIRNAHRPPTPTSWQGHEIPLIFFAGLKH
jgi:hypothetical protein